MDRSGACPLQRLTKGPSPALKRLARPQIFASIVDGTSNVLIVAEKWLNVKNSHSRDWHETQGWIDGWDPDIVRYTGFQPILDSNGSPYGFDGYQFGSRHPAGINGVMVDGSVHMINYNINLTMFNNIGHRADGASVTID